MPREEFPYMRWYPNDFDGDEDVEVMTDEQVGFYVRLLNHSWKQRGLPTDLKITAKLFGKSVDEFSALWEQVGHKFYQDSETGRWVNKRVERERAYAHSKSERASKAANTRHGNVERVGSADAVVEHSERSAAALHEQCVGSASANGVLVRYPVSGLCLKRDAWREIVSQPKFRTMAIRKLRDRFTSIIRPYGATWE